jgi:hypothetical protein
MAASANGIPHPLTWNSGRVCRYTSRSLTPACQPSVAAFSHNERCVSSTPFGLAVVPEV